jgi:hypothetical protein
MNYRAVLHPSGLGKLFWRIKYLSVWVIGDNFSNAIDEMVVKVSLNPLG